MRVTNGNPIAMANGEVAPPRVSEPQGILIRSDSGSVRTPSVSSKPSLS